MDPNNQILPVIVIWKFTKRYCICVGKFAKMVLNLFTLCASVKKKKDKTTTVSHYIDFGLIWNAQCELIKVNHSVWFCVAIRTISLLCFWTTTNWQKVKNSSVVRPLLMQHCCQKGTGMCIPVTQVNGGLSSVFDGSNLIVSSDDCKECVCTCVLNWNTPTLQR